MLELYVIFLADSHIIEMLLLITCGLCYMKDFLALHLIHYYQPQLLIILLIHVTSLSDILFLLILILICICRFGFGSLGSNEYRCIVLKFCVALGSLLLATTSDHIFDSLSNKFFLLMWISRFEFGSLVSNEYRCIVWKFCVAFSSLLSVTSSDYIVYSRLYLIKWQAFFCWF